jgi:hypothetical protein
MTPNKCEIIHITTFDITWIHFSSIVFTRLRKDEDINPVVACKNKKPINVNYS